MDLSEGGYGVSLINDCKYGHDIRDNVIRLTLLRSPTSPDPDADRGVHTFAYSLLPHAGRWGRQTIAEAYALNDPVIVHRAGSGTARPEALPAAASLVATDAENVVIETVKQAEDNNGLIIRLYECMRQRGTITLRTGFPQKEAWLANLLEENETALPVSGDSVAVPLTPYRIATIRLVPRL